MRASTRLCIILVTIVNFYSNIEDDYVATIMKLIVFKLSLYSLNIFKVKTFLDSWLSACLWIAKHSIELWCKSKFSRLKFLRLTINLWNPWNFSPSKYLGYAVPTLAIIGWVEVNLMVLHGTYNYNVCNISIVFKL